MKQKQYRNGLMLADAAVLFVFLIVLLLIGFFS